MRGTSAPGSRSRRLLWMTAAAAVGLGAVPTAAAHEGASHASLPHWALLLLVLLGIGVVVGTLRLARQRDPTDPRLTVLGVLLGATVAMIGTVGVIEIQVEPIGTSPVAREWYPLLTGVTGFGLATASLLVGYLRWPQRPRYGFLGVLLGAWVMYPVLVSGSGYWHPLGYLLVLLVPGVVGYIVWRDVRMALTREVLDATARRLSVVVMTLFTTFFLFSAGLLSVNPSTGAAGSLEGFVTVAQFANPLVIWPAIEFYFPSVPVGGALSVGTALVAGLLAGLMGLNSGLVTAIWRRDLELDSSQGAFGALATTGATACCCCGPAIYALSSAVLGLSASPLYWAFIDPTSPVGALFLVAAVVLLTGSAVQLAGRLAAAGVCERPAG